MVKMKMTTKCSSPHEAPPRLRLMKLSAAAVLVGCKNPQNGDRTNKRGTTDYAQMMDQWGP
jgi:hypothetical protein